MAILEPVHSDAYFDYFSHIATLTMLFKLGLEAQDHWRPRWRTAIERQQLDQDRQSFIYFLI